MLLLALVTLGCGGPDDSGQAASPSSTTTATPRPASEPPATTTTTTAVTEDPEPEGLTVASRIHTRGVGPITAGMGVDEASAAAGVALDLEWFDAERTCGYAVPRGFANLRFMVLAVDDAGQPLETPTVARAEALGEPWLTVSGVGVGASVADVQGTYGERVRVQPHAYSETGVNLVYEPVDPAEQSYGVRFESSDGGTVDHIFGGDAVAIAFEEGCA